MTDNTIDTSPLIAVGKSARLLREGDRVAVSDLHPGDVDVDSLTEVVDVLSNANGTTFVNTTDHGVFLTPSARLVRLHTGGETA